MSFPRGLPASFVGPVHQHLQPQKNENGRARLPFLGPPGSDPGIRHWNVPATGGYMGGCETGEALALVYLKHERTHGQPLGSASCCLTHIVTSFLHRFEAAGKMAIRTKEDQNAGDRCRSFHGQYVGFLNTLSHWLVIAAQTQGHMLDRMTERELLHRANMGLAFDEAAFLKSEGHKRS